MSYVMEIGLKVDDADARRTAVERLSGREDARLVREAADGRLDILVADLGGDPAGRIDQLEDLLARGAVREAILLGRDPDPDLLIRAMRAGVKEFVALPLADGELEAALDRIRGRVSDSGQACSVNGEVLSVVGAAGGLGATTLAVNLAWELQDREPGSTVLVDLRRPHGEVPLFLDLDYSYTWGEVAENISRMDQTFLRSVLAEAGNGLRILPSPPADQWPKPSASPEAMRQCLSGLCEMFRYVVVEDNRGLDAISREVLAASRIQWLAMSLSVTCLARVKRHLDEAAREDASFSDRIRLAAARVVKGADIGEQEAAEVLGKSVSFTVPDDLRGTMAAINRGQPLAVSAPKSPVLKAVRDMAVEAAGEVKPAAGKSFSLFGFLSRSRKGERSMSPQPA